MIHRFFYVVTVLLLVNAYSQAQDKVIITRAEDLPKHVYTLTNRNASEIVLNRDAVLELATIIKKDIQSDMAKYDIRDNATMRSLYARLRLISTLEGDYETALEYISQERKYADKKSEQIIRAMDAEALLKTAMAKNTLDPEILNPEITSLLEDHMNVGDFSVIQEDVEELKGELEIVTENLMMGMVKGQLQQAIDNNKEEIPGDLVTSLLGIYYSLNYYLPYKEAFYQAAVNSLEKFGKDIEKANIWKERGVSLKGKEGLARVIIGIWDTGVDMEILPKENRWTNTKEKFDDTDTDGNGFVDDVYGIAYTLEGLKDPHYLFPEAHNLSNIDEYQKYLKGLMDLMANINSEDASEIRQYISGLQPEEVDPFIEKLNMYGLYSHGTHVAGIAIEGNPYAAVLVARLTGDYRNIPAPYTDIIVGQLARSQKEVIKYFKDNGVRVVNMSWSESYESIVSILELNGVGENDEERKELGKKYFNTLYNSFTKAIKSAPEILFITSSGNSNDDVDFTGSYPNTVNVPNLITVGAVDIEGKKTNFTTEGESVDVYANGYEVESFVPGGNRIPLSGTSMSTPQVVNLAAKILAVNPGLTPVEVKDIIMKTSTRSDEDENVLLIYPMEAVKLAKK